VNELKHGVNLFVSRERDAAVGAVLNWSDRRLLEHPRERITFVSTSKDVASSRSRIHLSSSWKASAYGWILFGGENWTLRTREGELMPMHDGGAVGLLGLDDPELLNRIRNAGWFFNRWLFPERFAVDVGLADLESLRVVHKRALKSKVPVVASLSLSSGSTQAKGASKAECEMLARTTAGCSLNDVSSQVMVAW